MTALKLGIIGLDSADISRVKILLRLLTGSHNLHWVYVAKGPFDATLTAQGVATLPGAVRIDVLPAGAAAVRGALVLPVEAGALENVLYSLQKQLQPAVFGEVLAATPPVLGSANASAAVPATTVHNLPVMDDTAEYKLKRWPPQAILRDSKDRIRIANLISRKSFSVAQIVISSGISKTEVQSFITVLQSFGIVNVDETTLAESTVRLYTHSRAASSQAKAKRSLLSAIRRTLGI